MPNRKKNVVKKKKKKEAPPIKCNIVATSPEKQRTESPTSCPTCSKPYIRDYDISGVKRILSPFNRFSNTSIKKKEKTLSKSLSYKSPFMYNGLTSKEKCYVLTSCQARSTRYIKLKSLATEAIKNNKIFTVYGYSKAVRKAMLERGWVEKMPPNRMNLSHIRNSKDKSKTNIHGELETILLSNFVEKQNANFIWHMSRDDPLGNSIDLTSETHTIINKLNVEALWTTKQGLCTTMKGNYWYYIENVSEVNIPRTYMSYDPGEMEDFISDYKLSACTSLLKWILAMINNNKQIFVKTGKIPLNVIVFALNRCKEYLFRKHHKDIDKTIHTINIGQWNAYLKKYYQIITKAELFQADEDNNKLPVYLGFAKFLLKEIYRYRPQLVCEGCHNIWIIKPAHCSRGRGIRMASQLGVITSLVSKSNAKYVIQKYIEEPLLIHDTKFDVRQYYLVTSTYPLVIWMYTDCYLKFSSQKYSLQNFHESIHLTNNAVQRKYNNCADRHPELPKHNMWDSDTYRTYLNKIGKENVWSNIIYPGMKKSIIGIMLACQDSCLGVAKNRFELYGCDFILDKEYKPWLIEINSNPDLNPTTQVTAKICPEVVSDVIKVVIDYAANSRASTGKFECIYRQSMTVPKYGVATDLIVRGYSLSVDYFYKGKICNVDSPEFDKNKDIDLILDKLRRINEQEPVLLMMNNEDDSMSNEKKEKETNTHRTRSEYDLDVAATVINEQLDELMARITSESKSVTNTKISRKSLGSSYSRNVRFSRCMMENDYSKDSLSSDNYLENGRNKVCASKSSLVSNPIPKDVDYKTEHTNKFESDKDAITKASMIKEADRIHSFLHKIEMEYKIDCNAYFA